MSDPVQPAIQSRPAMQQGGYGPWILNGSLHQGQTPVAFSNRLGCYSLWYVDAGLLQVNGKTFQSPAGFLLGPEMVQVTAAVATKVLHVEFDPLWRPELATSYGGGRLPRGLVRSETRQPPPQEIWGINLPETIPHELLNGLHHLLTIVLTSWYRDIWHQAEAQSRLGVWLARLCQQLASETDFKNPKQSEWLGQIQTLALRQLATGLGVQELAMSMGMERSAFSRRFTREAGTSPSAWLLRLRMIQAMALLQKSKHSISKVAKQCGYDSSTAFSAAFHNYSGMPPSKWRRLR